MTINYTTFKEDIVIGNIYRICACYHNNERHKSANPRRRALAIRMR